MTPTIKQIVFFLFLAIPACNSTTMKNDYKEIFLSDSIPGDIPLDFMPNLVPDSLLIHRGVFSPNMQEFHYTISDKNFTSFDIEVLKKEEGKWSKAQKAFYNSQFMDHGMSFSPDGQTIYFSSTRPTGIRNIADTWHIWKSEKKSGKWSIPKYVDFPNLKDKLVSHPSISDDGTLFFHVSNLDYSNMKIYYCKLENGKYKEAIEFNGYQGLACCPFISPDGSYLIFAAIKEQLELYICHKTNENWNKAIKLPEIINNKGQGNPSVSPDGKFLFYACETGEDNGAWTIKWVRTDFL